MSFCTLSENSPASCGFCGINHKGAVCNGKKDWPSCPYSSDAPAKKQGVGKQLRTTRKVPH